MKLDLLLDKLNNKTIEFLKTGNPTLLLMILSLWIIGFISLLLVLLVGVYFNLYIWLIILSLWVILHIKKSVGTWSRFVEIEKSLSDCQKEILDLSDKINNKLEQKRLDD